jgi:hypothetical protein
MSTAVNNSRKDVIDFLVRKYRSQTELAKALNHTTITQPNISLIQNHKRYIRTNEARDIEKTLGIPKGWMDKDNWVRSGWSLIKEYRNLEDSEKELINRIVNFVIEKSETNS